MFGLNHIGKLGAGEEAAGGGDPGEGFRWNTMEDVQFSEFMKLCGDGLAKRGNYEPAQIRKGLKPRGPYGFKGMEVSPDGLGQFPIKKGLLIGIEKRAFGLPLDNKIHFLKRFSVSRGPALIDLTVDRKNARIIVEPMSGAVPTSGGWPW
jgi:hypothetical protein